MRIYVGNLPYSSTTQDVEHFFGACGTVNKVDFVIDRDTGRPRGFAFVDMDDEGAQRAISELNGSYLGGRPLVVNQARERQRTERNDRPRRERRDRDWT